VGELGDDVGSSGAADIGFRRLGSGKLRGMRFSSEVSISSSKCGFVGPRPLDR
jgi:hypothetical protein